MRTGKRLASICRAVLALAALALFCAAAADAADKKEQKETRCRLVFRLQGWSALYETASGSGTITCDNGQSRAVRIETKGGGLTAGKYRLRGSGRFSAVPDISELFGGYAKAEAHAGVVQSAGVQVVTKGDISLAIKATGKGVNLGIAFGSFRITPAGRKSGT